jgi:hypothetical protein
VAGTLVLYAGSAGLVLAGVLLARLLHELGVLSWIALALSGLTIGLPLFAGVEHAIGPLARNWRRVSLAGLWTVGVLVSLGVIDWASTSLVETGVRILIGGLVCAWATIAMAALVHRLAGRVEPRPPGAGAP